MMTSQACDTIDNIDSSVYGEMMDAAAYTLQVHKIVCMCGPLHVHKLGINDAR